MVRLRCADRLGASAYPVCRVGRKRRTEGCRAGAVRDGETAFSRDASEAFGTAAESFFKGMPPGMCGEARGGTPQGIFPKRRFRLDAGYGGR